MKPHQYLEIVFKKDKAKVQQPDAGPRGGRMGNGAHFLAEGLTQKSSANRSLSLYAPGPSPGEAALLHLHGGHTLQMTRQDMKWHHQVLVLRCSMWLQEFLAHTRRGLTPLNCFSRKPISL